MNRRLCFLFAALPLLMGAEVYRYVDKDGVVTYTEMLPFGVQGQRVMSEAKGPTQTVREVGAGATPATADSGAGTAAGAQPANEKMPLTEEQQAMLDQLNAAEVARRAELAKIRESNCTRSREVLERLSVEGRIRVRDASGQERAMPDDERARRIREAQDGIVANCDAGA